MPQELTIEIPLDEGEPLGATPNEALSVIRIQANTAAENRLRVGGRITHIKGIQLKDIGHFYQLLRYAHPTAHLTIVRPDAPAAPAQDADIPENRKAFFVPQNGFTYKFVSIKIVGVENLGLSLRSLRNRVYVSRPPPNDTKAFGQFFYCDRIIDINEKPVSDQHVAELFIRTSIQASGSFNAVVERPTTNEKKAEVTKELNAPLDDPSVPLAEDVRLIAHEERGRIALEQAKKICNPNQPASVTEQPQRVPNPDARVSFNETANVKHNIGNDNKKANLRPVR